jgi:hypothetical protein
VCVRLDHAERSLTLALEQLLQRAQQQGGAHAQAAAVMAAAAAPQESADLETQMTVTPWRARVSAMARPMPRPAPVTTATRAMRPFSRPPGSPR